MDTSSLGSFMTLSFGTTSILKNITYASSTMKFMTVLSSSIEMSNIKISQISLSQNLIECIGCERVIWHNVVIDDITATSKYVIFLSKSVINLISNLTVTDVNAIAYHIVKTNITLFDNVNILNATSGIRMEQSQMNLFQHSLIMNCGSESITNGGTLLIDNSNSIISNVTFGQSVAQIGGAIYIG